MRKGSKLVIHWHKKFMEGMAYVMLGRCERLEDIYIAGDFDIGKIKASPEALIENQRIVNQFQSNLERRSFMTNCLRISYLNVRSLGEHFQDVLASPDLMESTILAVAETWLEPGQTIELPQFPSDEAIFQGGGRGKGLAVFPKVSVMSKKYSAEGVSAVVIKLGDIIAAFLYLSSGVDWTMVTGMLDLWISSELPTVVMGDMNWHWDKDSQHPMQCQLAAKGFQQLIEDSTHDQGNCLDHIYANKKLLAMNPVVETQANYFTDHDTITLFLPEINMS